MQLRPYQVEDLQVIKTEFESGVKRQLVKASTGLGKTVDFANIMDALGFKGRMLVLVHRDELADQACKKIKAWNPKKTVGLEMGDCYSSQLDQIVVAGVQTLGRKGSSRLEKFRPADFDVIVCDESHHCLGATYQTVFKHFKLFDTDSKILLVGFTATVNRADGQGLGQVFEKIVIGTGQYDRSIKWGIINGWLVNLRAFKVNTRILLDSVHTFAGDLHPGELERLTNTKARNELIVNTWLSKGENRPTIAFTVGIQHAKDLAAVFKLHGVQAEAIWGVDPDRKEKLRRHRAGDIRILCNANVLTEGYDDPNVSCIIMARDTKSEGLYQQMIGRGTRLPEGINNLLEALAAGKHLEKIDCLVIDVVDVSSKHSLVTMPSLFGIPAKMDTAGKPITEVIEELDEAQKKAPSADLSRLDKIDDLDEYIKTVDLFKVEYPAEIVQISEYQWHRTRDGSYVLLLAKGEDVVVYEDLLDSWVVTGTVNGARFHQRHTDFEAAIKEADSMVRVLGGRSLTSLAKRKASWHSKPVSALQLGMCKRLKITVPPGVTQGEVHNRINAELARRNDKRDKWKQVKEQPVVQS